VTIPFARPPGTPLGAALVTADAVAEFLQVDRSTIFRLAGREIPVVEVGRSKRFRVGDVLAYVERRTRGYQGRSSGGDRVLAAVRQPRRNELATSRRQSVHRKHESSARAAGTAEAAG
jgi:hypothetical protein